MEFKIFEYECMSPIHIPHLISCSETLVYTGLFHAIQTILVLSYHCSFPPMTPLYLECLFHLCLLFQNAIDRHLARTFVSIQVSKSSQLKPFGIWLGSCNVLLVLKSLLSHCHLYALKRTNTLENNFPLDEKAELVRELPKLLFFY